MTSSLKLATVTENNVTSYKKLFIVGCPRSGTTWLWQMLNRHADTLSAPKESHLYRLIYKPFTFVPQMKRAQRFQQRLWFLKHYGLLPLIFGASSQDMWRGVLRSYRIYERAGEVGPHTIINFDELKTLIQSVRQQPESDLNRAKHLIATVFDRYFQRAGGESRHLFMEKTPMHIDCVDVMLKQFPEAKAIIVARDGRDVCASWQARAKTQKWARRSTDQLIRQWNRCAELSQQFQADPELCDRVRLIRYEDLRSQPAAELEALLDFLTLSASSDQIQGIIDQLDINKIAKKGEGRHVRKGSVGDWRKTLSDTDIHLWNSQAKEALLQLGYSV